MFALVLVLVSVVALTVLADRSSSKSSWVDSEFGLSVGSGLGVISLGGLCGWG